MEAHPVHPYHMEAAARGEAVGGRRSAVARAPSSTGGGRRRRGVRMGLVQFHSTHHAEAAIRVEAVQGTRRCSIEKTRWHMSLA